MWRERLEQHNSRSHCASSVVFANLVAIEARSQLKVVHGQRRLQQPWCWMRRPPCKLNMNHLVKRKGPNRTNAVPCFPPTKVQDTLTQVCLQACLQVHLQRTFIYLPLDHKIAALPYKHVKLAIPFFTSAELRVKTQRTILIVICCRGQSVGICGNRYDKRPEF